jgi:A/G-specific adenine glycosylase
LFAKLTLSTQNRVTHPNQNEDQYRHDAFMTPATFQRKVLAWFDQHGRKDLPWQQIMLQQTQVATVIPYFQAFVAKFPTVETLAQASVDEALQSWSGLGYYARARNLHKTAQIIAKLGRFPSTLAELIALPGVGLSTAGAILSIAFHIPQPILDGNVKRVLARFKAIPGWTGNTAVYNQLWEISAILTPTLRVADYTQAMMDLGATVCTRSKPACEKCPLASDCMALSTQQVAVLPTSKTTKALPIKELVFLLLHDHHQLILEKRPPTGIWGGLWSLPEFTNEDAAVNWCITNNLEIRDKHFGDKHRHTFSHYHLDYRTLTIETHSTGDFVQEADKLIWHNAGQIDQLGLATPIKQLLQQHFR